MIHENLKRLRIANKLTQQQVADHLMISNQSISKWEKGEALPSIEFLPQIAELFNCSVNAFFSDYEADIFVEMASRNLSLEESNDIAWKFIAAIMGDGSTEKEMDAIEKYPELSIPVEAMFLPAMVDILNENQTIGIGLLQKKLGVGYYIASEIIKGLESLGVIVYEKQSYQVVKDNIALLNAYLPKK